MTYISATSRRIALCSLASALDAEAEEEVQAVIAALTRRRTSFVIAHRRATVVYADQIVVLRMGESSKTVRTVS